MKNLLGKNALVTGGSRGIGAATVELLAQLGANVAFNYNNNQKAAEKLGEKLEELPGKRYTQRCDVTKYDEVKNFISNTIERFGKIDILVNNAGIWEYGEIDTMSNANWQRTMQANLNSVYYFTKDVVAHMKKEKISGRIVHVASTAGQRGEAFHSHYAASKGAIISFTKSLASELGPWGIYVNCVAPGWVNTDMSQKAIEQEGKEILRTIPLNRIPEAHEIAGPIVFLVSEWASAITGEILNVNAGSVLCG